MGEELYRRKCQGCHGPLAGPGSWLIERTQNAPESVFNAVLEGRGEMPAFRSRLPEALVEDVVYYLRLGGVAPSASEP